MPAETAAATVNSGGPPAENRGCAGAAREPASLARVGDACELGAHRRAPLGARRGQPGGGQAEEQFGAIAAVCYGRDMPGEQTGGNREWHGERQREEHQTPGRRQSAELHIYAGSPEKQWRDGDERDPAPSHPARRRVIRPPFRGPAAR